MQQQLKKKATNLEESGTWEGLNAGKGKGKYVLIL